MACPTHLPLLAISLLWLSSCGGGDAVAEVRSAVLITLDTTTPDSLDVYGSNIGVTPHLSALAERAVVFEVARTVAPLTLPAHASMLTGLYPYRHTVRDNGHLRLPDSALTLAEHARAAGHSTAAFIAAGVLAKGYGLGQGFDTYEAPSAQDIKGGFGTRWAGDVTKRAIAWLDGREEDRPFFLWVHYFDPHSPYNPPPKFAAQFPDNPYLGEVAAMDHQIGKLIARLSEEPDHESTTIVVVGDHGEAFGINGERSHGSLLHDATLRVPLLVRFPGNARAGSSREDLVSVVDVFPTLLAQMGLEIPVGLDGQDLAGPTARSGVYAENYSGFLSWGWAPLVGWAREEGLYVHGRRPSFERWGGDGRLRAVRGDEPWVAESRRALAAVERAPVLRRPEQEALIDSDPVALGYAGGGGVDVEIPPPLEVPEGLPAPSDRLGEPDRVFGALMMADKGKLEEGIRELQNVVDENHRSVFAHDQLGNLLLRAQRPRKALVVLRALIDAGFERPSVRRRMSLAYTMLGDYPKARAELDRYQELCPEDPDARAFRVKLEREMEDE